jgi:hydroxyethylthiazole kinase-like uncharacterized protein yjeF
MGDPTEISTDLLRRCSLPEYSAGSHKGDRGKLLVIAGSRHLPGAPILIARAALRSGCGSVRVAAPESIAIQIGVALPELMVIPLAETTQGTLAAAAQTTLDALYAPCDAAVIGPGLGQHEQTKVLIRQVIESAPLPLVIDAEALHALGVIAGPEEPLPAATEQTPVTERDETLSRIPAPRVYTPHPTEMCWLTGTTPEALACTRESTSRDFARQTGATLVLKGSRTLITSPSGEQFVNTAGTRALATAGSGDTLAGILGSLLAQGMDAAPAAIWAVHLHALAGESAARELGEDGLLASDFVERLPGILRDLRRQTT